MKNPLKLFIALSLLFSAGLAGCGSKPAPTPGPEVVAVTGISTTEEGFSLIVGEEHTLVYTVAPENATNKEVTVATESEAVSIEGSVVKGVSEGEAIVTVTTIDGGFTVSYNIIVKASGITFSFSERVAEYEAAGYTGVEIPDYVCADSSATLSAIEGYDGYYLIKPSSAAEMEAFVASFSSAWDDETDSYGDHHLYLGSPEPGESCPYIYVGDYTAESLAGIVIEFSEYTEPAVAAGFPLEEVNAYLTENSSDYGFTISEAEAAAISELSDSFVFYSGTYNGYPICQITIGGEVAAEVEAIMVDTITAAGFEYYSTYEAYYNSIYCMISFAAEEGYTYFTIY